MNGTVTQLKAQQGYGREMATLDIVDIDGNSKSVPRVVIDTTGLAGGYSAYHKIAAATTNAANVKATPGIVHAVQVSNNSTVIGFLKIYDKSTAPVPGTDTPVAVIQIPGNTAGAGAHAILDIACVNGIGIAITGGIADNDTTATAASTMIVNLAYA